jgi:ArsR family transcriptional regulator
MSILTPAKVAKSSTSVNIWFDIDRYGGPMTTRTLPLVDTACCAPLGEDPLDAATADVLAHAFKALADPVRLRLLSIIAAAPTGEVCACDLAGPVGKSQPTVSHHLKVLREAGLVASSKRGTWVHYRAVPERLAALRELLGSGGLGDDA